MKRNETEWNGNEPLFTFVAGSVFARALLNKRQSTRKRIESNNNRNDKKEPNHISRDIPRSTQLFLPIPFRLSHCFSPSFFLCFDLSVSWSLGLSVSGSRSELVLSFFLFFFCPFLFVLLLLLLNPRAEVQLKWAFNRFPRTPRHCAYISCSVCATAQYNATTRLSIRDTIEHHVASSNSLALSWY